MSALDCFAHSVTFISGIGRWTAVVNDVAFLLSRVIWENEMMRVVACPVGIAIGIALALPRPDLSCVLPMLLSKPTS